MQTAKKLNILNVSPHGYLDIKPVLGRTDTGGQVLYIVEMAKALGHMGCQVDVATRLFDDRAQVEDICEGGRILRLPAGPGHFVPKEEIGQYLGEFTQNLADFIDLHGIKYDLVHGHYWDGALVAGELAKRYNLPLYVTPHSLGAWKREQLFDEPCIDLSAFEQFKERIAVEHRVFGQAKRITAASTTEVELLRRFYSIGSEKVDIVPPGFNDNRFYADDKAESPYDRPFIFATGRHAISKGFHHLIHAFAGLVPERDLLLVIGGGGSAEPSQEEKLADAAIQEAIAEHHLQDRVILAGHLDVAELARHMQTAAAFVLASSYEPFGIVVLEAMACNTPVIVSSHGGIKDILRHEDNCLIIEPTNHEEVKRAIAKIIDHPDYGRYLAKTAHDMVIQQFTWKNVAATLYSTYLK
jgi:mannosylfructose-phosphate synthase